MFVVQEHHASHLHFDLRLEWRGVLKSWAIPKGPSPHPNEKRLAVQVEDHPYEYGKFQGIIPEGQYGSGEVLLWDKGSWEPEGNVDAALKKGHLDFTLKGKRMKGRWSLIRIRTEDRQPNWLLFKRNDEYADNENLYRPIKKNDPKVIRFVNPQLPLLVKSAPEGKEWVHEMKFDGYRIQTHLSDGKVTLFTRNGLDWTEKYPALADAFSSLDCLEAVIDGEIVTLDSEGRSDFQALQSAMKNEENNAILFYGFDLLFLNGKDLRQLPLFVRKEQLKKLLKSNRSKLIRYSDHLKEGKKFFAESCKLHLEGIVSKKIDSPYESGRNHDWVKTKCEQRQEFVIGGYTDPQGERPYLGALLLGVYEDGKFRYVGKCGTGFDQDSLKELSKTVKPLETKVSPFAISSPKEKGIHWLKPKLVAEISFSMWTRDQLLRVPVFHGLREDKPARQIKKEEAAEFVDNPGITLTHPDKILYSKEKITKKQIADYYTLLASQIIPLIRNRPLSLVRCPSGTDEECFYQKHLQQKKAPLYISIDSEEALLSLVQMDAFEIHSWGSKLPEIDHPDQIVMDFDPSSEVPFSAVKKAALEMKKILDYLDLKSFVKLSGGKGLHVHIPIATMYTWNEIKEFSKVLAEEMCRRFPDLYTATMSKKSRKGKIFIDYLRNSKQATAVIPYSLRANKISAVALPIDWKDLPRIKTASQFTLAKAIAYLKRRKKDPWKGYTDLAQKIEILEPEN